MQDRRVIAMTGLFFVLFALLQSRLVGLSLNLQAARAAAVQSSCVLPLYAGRAEFYDCRMRTLTGAQRETVALALPGDESYARLYRWLSAARAAALYGSKEARPSLVPLVRAPGDAAGLSLFTRPQRSYTAPIAVHTLGYLKQDGSGAAGPCTPRMAACISA